jgi:hypothetical protein
MGFRSILVVFAIAATLANAQVAIQQGMTADSHCGQVSGVCLTCRMPGLIFILSFHQGYCFTALYSPQSQSINYTLVHSRSGTGDVGWWAIAQGEEMKGANMAVSEVLIPDYQCMLTRGTSTDQLGQCRWKPDYLAP